MQTELDSVRFPLMKHGFSSLLLTGCLLLLSSCGYFSSQQQSSQAQVPTPPETIVNAPSKEDAQLRANLRNFKKPEGTYQATRPLSLNLSPIPEEDEQTLPLPGDNRAGLRTPNLPSTLLYDVDGKLTTTPIQ